MNRWCTVRRFTSKSTLPTIFIAKNSIPKKEGIEGNNNELIINDMKNWIDTKHKEQSLIKKHYQNEMLKEFDKCLVFNLDRYKDLSTPLPQSKTWKDLGELIEKCNAKLSVKEEHRVILTSKQEMLYKDVLYDEVFSGVKSGILERFVVDYRPIKKQDSTTRNLQESAEKAKKIALKSMPRYPKYHYIVTTPIGKYTDQYHWLHNEIGEEFVEMEEAEEIHSELLEGEFNTLRINIEAQLNSYKLKTNPIPLPIFEYTYKRGIDKENAITIVRESKYKGKEIVFSIRDLYNLYETHYKHNNSIKQFVEKLNEGKSTRDLIHNFLVDKDNKYLVISFNTNDESNREMLIKDLMNNTIYPVIIHSTTGLVAIEGDSIYFVKNDLYKRGKSLYQYLIKENKTHLVYEEEDTDYSISVSQSKTGEYVFIEIGSNYYPYTSEVWFKAVHSGNKFALYSPMKHGTSYNLQQAGDYFYVLTNEDRPYHYLMKVKIPDELLYKNKAEANKVELSYEQSFSLMPMKREENTLSLEMKEMKTENKRITALRNRTTASNHFFSRHINLKDYNLTIQGSTNNNRLIQPPVIEKSLFYEGFQEKSIVDFSVFQYYVMAKTKEPATPQVLIKNLLRDTQHQVRFPESPLDLAIEPNMNYNSNIGMITTSHISHPEVYHEYNMSLQKIVSRPLVVYENINTGNYVDEKIVIRVGDGTDLSTRLVYHKDYFGENSPAILFTDGSRTGLNTFAFKPWISSLLEKGCTLVYPEIRGTLVSDYDWYVKGILKNKIKHFTDFGRIANYLKEQKIAKKLSAFGNGISGSLTVSTVMLNEPTLFESVVLKVAV